MEQCPACGSEDVNVEPDESGDGAWFLCNACWHEWYMSYEDNPDLEENLEEAEQ